MEELKAVEKANVVEEVEAAAEPAAGMTNAEAQVIQDAAVAKAIEGAAISHKASMKELAGAGGGQSSKAASTFSTTVAALDDKEKLKATGFKSGYTF